MDKATLGTIADVLTYLKEAGWKVTKTSLYRHHKEGKIAPRADGTYGQKETDKYARTWLKQQSTGKRLSEKTDELQRKKLEQELQNEALKYQHKKLRYEKDLGKYVPKEQVELDLAGRAGILEAGLKNWVQSNAAGWIRLVDGDMKKVGELINYVIRELDEHINSYASDLDYHVVIDREEEEEQQDQAEG